MPLTQAEMEFVSNHHYELFNFDRPTPAHKALRTLGLDFGVLSHKFRRFQILWQKQIRRDGSDELQYFWVEPPSRSSFILPWPTSEAFEVRHLELYAEEILLSFEDDAHPLRFPRFAADRKGSHSSHPLPVFTPEEDGFLDAYFDEIRSLTIGPCLAAVDGSEIPHREINLLVGYRGTELLHAGRPWPQPHAPSPPIPWSSLEDFKRRFFPPMPDFPYRDYVPLDRVDLSARERIFLAHYLREVTSLTPGPAHEYLRSESLSPILMVPFLKHVFSYVSFNSSSKFLDPACKFLMDPLPPFEVPWGSKSIFLGRVLRFSEGYSMKTLVRPYLPSEDSAYDYNPVPYRFFLSQEKEIFLLWYRAEVRDATGGLMPATLWLWANGVYPSTLEAFLHAFRRPSDHFYEGEGDHPLPPFVSPWQCREEFEARLRGALEEFPELKDKPSALPGYRPEGYEERRAAWLRSIPKPPSLDTSATPVTSSL